MDVRPPAVAGAFYEGDPKRLRAQVESCFAENAPVPAKEKFIGAVVPHAGLMYSGHVAAAFYGMAELPKRFIILCPNHTGLGHFAAINREGDWRTPLGNVLPAEPTGQVFEWHWRTMMQPIATSDSVPIPNSSAPRIAAITTTAPWIKINQMTGGTSPSAWTIRP